MRKIIQDKKHIFRSSVAHALLLHSLHRFSFISFHFISRVDKITAGCANLASRLVIASLYPFVSVAIIYPGDNITLSSRRMMRTKRLFD